MKVNCNDEGIRKSVEIIENGGVIIFPTDTVYGIGCNPYDANAVKKIYEIKSRERIKSLPVLASSIHIVKQISIIDEFTEKIIKSTVPIESILSVAVTSKWKSPNSTELT